MREEKLWVYAVLPVVVLNLGLLLAIVAYFGLAATQPALLAGFGQAQLSFVLSVFICIVEWNFSISLVRRLGWAGARMLVAQAKSVWEFKRTPAPLIFIILNGIFAAYVAYVIVANGPWYCIEGLSTWQVIFMLAVVPATAVSFALIHGIWLSDKLPATFLIGLVASFYYAREHNLVPLMTAHMFMDVWSFGLSVL